MILAKTNMGEFAWSPFESRGSLFGVVRNPYDPKRTVGGEQLLNSHCTLLESGSTASAWLWMDVSGWWHTSPVIGCTCDVLPAPDPNVHRSEVRHWKAPAVLCRVQRRQRCGCCVRVWAGGPWHGHGGQHAGSRLALRLRRAAAHHRPDQPQRHHPSQVSQQFPQLMTAPPKSHGCWELRVQSVQAEVPSAAVAACTPACNVETAAGTCRLNRDTIGIIARTVDDVARVLGAVAGYDPTDPQTALVQTQTQPDDWTYYLDKHG